jgi:hypothetical protein
MRGNQNHVLGIGGAFPIGKGRLGNYVAGFVDANLQLAC